jgi:hypothetical protein
MRSSMAKTPVAAAIFLVLALGGCSSSPGTLGAASNQTGKHATTTSAVTHTTSPIVNTPAAEASYKNSAEVVTIEQLVDGRINAPTFSVGTVVTFSGTIERFLHYSSGKVSGLVLKDATSPAVIYVRLSERATAADSEAPNFMDPMDVVTVWGNWQADASVDNFPPGPTTYSGVVEEVFLSDLTTGTSDNVG